MKPEYFVQRVVGCDPASIEIAISQLIEDGYDLHTIFPEVCSQTQFIQNVVTNTILVGKLRPVPKKSTKSVKDAKEK